MEYSYLEVTVKTNKLGIQEAVTYSLNGKSPYTFIIYRFLEKSFFNPSSDSIQIGPYKLLLVEQMPDGNLYVRADRFGKLRVFIYRMTRLFDLAYRRFLITLAVWNLAEYRQWEIPTWKDVKIFRKRKK